MTLDQHTLTRIYIHTLTIVNIDNLKSAKALDFHQFILLQRLLDNIKHLSDEKSCVLFIQAITFREHGGQLCQ